MREETEIEVITAKGKKKIAWIYKTDMYMYTRDTLKRARVMSAKDVETGAPVSVTNNMLSIHKVGTAIQS